MVLTGGVERRNDRRGEKAATLTGGITDNNPEGLTAANGKWAGALVGGQQGRGRGGGDTRPPQPELVYE